MPICTTCTNFTPHLYTVYQSAHNLRLEQCTHCHKFVDPYVEHDDLILLLDLILLKPGVYRHLLFNRGRGARRETDNGEVAKHGSEDMSSSKSNDKSMDKALEKARWKTIIQLCPFLTFVDAFIRWSHLQRAESKDSIAPLTKDSIEPLLRICVGCMIETLAFYAGITFACAIVFRIVRNHRFARSTRNSTPSVPSSGIHKDFRLSHVPLTLLYSSLTKLFLLFCLSIWKPSFSAVAANTTSRTMQASGLTGNASLGMYDHWIIHKALELLDEDKLDREWVVRNLLGGMAAGFGLRVVLDVHPMFTTVIILSGWGVKTFVANLVHPWVGKNVNIGDVFLEYSIP